MGVKQRIGAFGEHHAAEHLREKGLEVLDRNWRCDEGEIDIVARDGETIVVCEVKTRSGLGWGSGLDAVTRQKCARLRRLAMRWMVESGYRGQVRIDVVAVHRNPDHDSIRNPEIEHVEAAC